MLLALGLFTQALYYRLESDSPQTRNDYAKTDPAKRHAAEQEETA